MSDAKHTPGPSLAHQLYCELRICNGDPHCFSGAPKDVQDRWEEAVEKIFGSVVYAAPDLLEHAVEAEVGIREAVRIMDLMGRGGDARELARHGNNLRAAFAKATGAA